MPIYYDTSEEKSTMPRDNDFIAFPGLESLTGADLFITAVGMPLTEQLLPLHVQNGLCMFIQRKRGLDLAASVTDGRLITSLAAMRAAGAKPHQAVLLFVGELTRSLNGAAYIDKQSLGIPYDAIDSAICKWNDRGGSFHWLPHDEYFVDWARKRESHLREYSTKPTRQFFVMKDIFDNDDPFQSAEAIRDFRVLLANLPGIGEKRALDLWEYYEQSPLEILVALTDWRHTKSHPVPGIGGKTVQKIRHFFGLEDEGDSAMEICFRWIDKEMTNATILKVPPPKEPEPEPPPAPAKKAEPEPDWRTYIEDMEE